VFMAATLVTVQKEQPERAKSKRKKFSAAR